jgi:Protein of unknown function, DUF417
MSTGQHMHDAALHTKAQQDHTISHEKRSLSSRVEAVGRELARYGLVVIVGWIGFLKFTDYEAEGIRLYVANSPLMSWAYGLINVREFSTVLDSSSSRTWPYSGFRSGRLARPGKRLRKRKSLAKQREDNHERGVFSQSGYRQRCRG